jgi:4-amino-4-deoxy-L-arabinose transferase-like glycosyltransferase
VSSTTDAARRREVWIAALLSVVPLLPFVTKAVSVDAPVFIGVAHQIVAHPLDPFGFQMIWDPTSPDVWTMNRNPPLLSYYLAPWLALFGEVDGVLHAAMLPFSLLAGLSFLGIARRVAGEGARPVALLVATPAYLVLATTLLLDVFTLAWVLLAVYAMLRGVQDESPRWQLAAGAAAAAAGLAKYVGASAVPLIAAGVLLLHPRPWRPLLRVLAPPLVAWSLWGGATAHLYGAVHFLGSADVVGETGRFSPDEFWNHLATVPVYYGCALLFPILLWGRGLLRGDFGTGLAVLGVIGGTLVMRTVIPDGEPPRRVPLGVDEATFGALGFAGAVFLWGVALRPRRFRGAGLDRFLLLWLVGYGVFTVFLNWHVNSADALLVAPPVILLVFRDPELRPSARWFAASLAVMLPLSLALCWADWLQTDTYRDAARKIAAEIGDRGGARYFVGHWGLQYYLERQGFQSVVPPHYGRSDLAIDDWVASARNISQLDVSQNMAEYQISPAWSWKYTSWLPLRTNNADAGAGFYSHHAGYVPFTWSDRPIEEVGLGRVTGIRRRPPGAR